MARILGALATNPGRWLVSQVGVNAPGTPNRTTRPLPRIAAVSVSLVPEAVTSRTGTDGTLSPVLIISSWAWLALKLVRGGVHHCGGGVCTTGGEERQLDSLTDQFVRP